MLDVIWGDGYIRIQPDIPPEITSELKYWHRNMRPTGSGGMETSGEYRSLFDTGYYFDDNSNVVNYMDTMPGFMHRIKTILDKAKYEYRVLDRRTPFPSPDMFRAMEGLWPYQREPSYDLIASRGGIAACPTGYGKTHIMGSLIAAFHPEDLKARNTPLVLVAAAERDLVNKNKKDLEKILPDREVRCPWDCESPDDVIVTTMARLDRFPPDEVGIFIADEVHTAATDKRSEIISGFRKAMKWGMSATPDGRFDGADLRTEGLFGPPAVTRTYQDGVAVGSLVPITVYFVNAPEPDIGLERFRKYKNKGTKVRHGIENNASLSRLVADLINRIPEDMQTLGIMQHINQMNSLREYMPDIEVVHAEQSGSKLAKNGFTNVPPISGSMRDRIYWDFAEKRINRLLATYVYKQGVNFPDLEVIVCPGGGGSKIVSGQIPGRGSRRIEGKDQAFIVDFWHPWDREPPGNPFTKTGKIRKKQPGTLLRDDKSRKKVYEDLGFHLEWVDTIDELPFVRGAHGK